MTPHVVSQNLYEIIKSDKIRNIFLKTISNSMFIHNINENIEVSNFKPINI